MDKAMTDVLKYKRKTFLFVFLAIALVLATWYKLKIQGITLTDDISYEEVLICENAEETHVHAAECYEKVAVTNSDKQNEINTTTENQTLNTADTSSNENSQKQEELAENNEKTLNSQEISEDNEKIDSLKNLENNQEEIPKDTEQIAKDTTSSNEISIATVLSSDVTSTLDGASTYAIGDTPTQNDTDVNVYVNIDGNWTFIGTLIRDDERTNNNYKITATKIIDLISAELPGMSLGTNQFNLLYFAGTSTTFSRATLNNRNEYLLGYTNTYKNVYITAGVTTSNQSSNNTLNRINNNNTLKVVSYLVTEYDLQNEVVSTDTVYTNTGNATYTLPTNYSHYTVNDSSEIVAGGETINITGPTTIRQTVVETCKITIIYADGTQRAVEVYKGSKYTLDSHLKWKVGDSTELTNGGTQITVTEDITIQENNQITIIYTVDTSTTATGLSSNFVYDGIAVPTVQGSSTYTTTVTYDAGTIVEKLSDNYVTPYNKNETVSKDRTVISFRGWKVNSTSTELQPETALTWEQLYSYAANGVINLNTIWKNGYQNYEHVNFYINYTSEAVDTNGNVETGRDITNYTPSLWASYVGNASNSKTPIADTTSDNSFKANKDIRALEGDKGDGSRFIFSFPEDEYIIEQLKKYANELSIDGQKIDVNELDLEHYEIRWYVFKLESGCWHIDGKLVRKEGKMVITKTFTGSKSAIEAVTGYSFKDKAIKNDTNYCINVKGGNIDVNLYTGTNSSPSPTITDNSTTVDGETTYLLNFSWTIDVKYGINYTIIEQNYTTNNYLTNTTYNIVDPESTKYKKIYNDDGSYYYEIDENGKFVPTYTNQSKGSTAGVTANVIGVNNYAMDSTEELDITKILTVNFSNTYAPTSAITIQKEDSVTNNGLANAEFSLYLRDSNGNINTENPLKFTYNESIYTYDVNGDKTVLTSPTGGSIIIDGLPSGQKYKLVEVSVPDGYDGNTSVEVTLDATGEGVIVPVITKGTGDGYDTTNKILELDNASKLTNVKVIKEWKDVPKEYIKDVIVELYLNNMPISSYDLNYDINGDKVVDENDTVQLRVTLNESNNWTYTWENLPLYVDGSKAIYTVREVQIGNIKAVTDGKYNSSEGTWESYDAYTQYRAHTTVQKYYNEHNQEITNETDIINKAKLVSFKLVNEIHLVKIEINKTSPLGKPIDGVEFIIQKLDEFGNMDTTFGARTLVTSKEGKLSFVDLEYDTRYVLTETKGNKGYYLDSTPIYVMIKKAEQQGAEDTLILCKDSTFTQEAQEADYEYVSLNDTKTILNVINIPHTEMPKAGGIGVYGFYILGILLMGSSIIIIYLRKNKIKKGR